LRQASSVGATDEENPFIYGAVDEDINDDLMGRDGEAYLQEEEEPDEGLRAFMAGSATEVSTGSFTPGGMSEDLTAGSLGGSKRMGGPTGGDIQGAGAGGGGQFEHGVPSHARGVDKPISMDTKDSGMASRTIEENTAELINEEMHHDR
jgi:hypothetical protein